MAQKCFLCRLFNGFFKRASMRLRRLWRRNGIDRALYAAVCKASMRLRRLWRRNNGRIVVASSVCERASMRLRRLWRRNDGEGVAAGTAIRELQ